MILRRLNARLDPINHEEWLAHIDRMKDMYPLRYHKETQATAIIEEIYDLTKGRCHPYQKWASIRCGPPSIINSGNREHF